MAIVVLFSSLVFVTFVILGFVILFFLVSFSSVLVVSWQYAASIVQTTSYTPSGKKHETIINDNVHKKTKIEE